MIIEYSNGSNIPSRCILDDEQRSAIWHDYLYDFEHLLDDLQNTSRLIKDDKDADNFNALVVAFSQLCNTIEKHCTELDAKLDAQAVSYPTSQKVNSL